MLSLLIALVTSGASCGQQAGAIPVPAAQVKTLSDGQLVTEVQHRAFRFFWEQADPQTGLVKDRASNSKPDDYTVASTASTG